MLAKTSTDLRQQYLREFIARYTQRTQTSKKMTQEYRAVLADPRVPDWFEMPIKELCYLIVAKQAQGSRVWDVDDNEYIDIMMGFGANLLGHNPPFIKDAIAQQLEKGIPLGPQAEQVGEVAELICELTGMERVAFSNTGTEAVMSAIRLARAATKRPKIVVFSGSYHGHFDSVLVKPGTNHQAEPFVPGIPSSLVQDTLVLEYGNPQSLEVIQTHQTEIAAVLVEPIQSRHPNLQPKAFLQELRTLTQATGIVLIFDEMVTGFRLHLGGAQAWFGVKADIATYGKVVGGGMPIGVIAGQAEYLDRIDGGMWDYGDDSFPQVERTFFAGTHCKHPLAIAAARAVLHYLKQQGPSLQEQLNQRTAAYVTELNHHLEACQLPVRMANSGSFFGPVFPDVPPSEIMPFMAGLNLLRYSLFHQGILLRGEGGGFFSTAHSEADIQAVLQAMKNGIRDLQEAEFFPLS
ncbi:aspartate aminotransferase family protein [Desertifilum sp. FACHB-1129]|uniref:Polyketide synthase n=1 Tax=Desertifilum tharense IPPAS B-1220 TaxID=1781255 RepID=A0A1E5QPU6_9CYAN|nr:MULTISPECIES: aspartate aminotransferase family protein [Desertifilum]MDA0209671.1 aspartate aminotransferase family protein [Cyanobacteria bacterium FC1]MBD2310837.1 aspartate aminotransferase family protein [Desertifilum sp. FACHB-1129]MBD2320874.1 aspartate aminotransferase family protein [Desertifilum sp. FACHB-866]MBD2331002.1 aspartate aminotransferase family protein [Desertifilum sp. FACHB-868]OEJ76692.1 polyketide synthase [Desertifilum tharense IPPAS B-1220]